MIRTRCFRYFFALFLLSIACTSLAQQVQSPNLLTDKNGEARTSFFSSDKKGTYTAWLEGSDMQGNFGFKAIQIVVK